MCVEILIDGKRLETMGALRAFLGEEPSILATYSGKGGPDHCCLCPVDVEALAARLGREVEAEGMDVRLLARSA